MKERRLLAICCVASGLLAVGLVATACASKSSPGSSSANTQVAATGTQNAVVSMPSFADLISTVEPSVVQIDISGTVNVGRRTVQQQGAGSGWIMDTTGKIVTNNHVVAGATTITVTTPDGKTFPAKVINTDPATDLAVIQISATGLKSMKIGDASKLRAGDWVLAIGNPLGEGIITTQGIVSRLGVTVP